MYGLEIPQDTPGVGRSYNGTIDANNLAVAYNPAAVPDPLSFGTHAWIPDLVGGMVHMAPRHAEGSYQAVPFNLIMGLNIHEELLPAEQQLLNRFALPYLLPLDLYLGWRSLGNNVPFTDNDFTVFFIYISDELEQYFEAGGLDLHQPAFGANQLVDVIAQITQPIMEIATRLGALSDLQTQMVFDQYPAARYMVDTCREMGPSGIGASFDIADSLPQPVGGLFRGPKEFRIATNAEATVGTTCEHAMSPAQARAIKEWRFTVNPVTDCTRGPAVEAYAKTILSNRPDLANG